MRGCVVVGEVDDAEHWLRDCERWGIQRGELETELGEVRGWNGKVAVETLCKEVAGAKEQWKVVKALGRYVRDTVGNECGENDVVENV